MFPEDLNNKDSEATTKLINVAHTASSALCKQLRQTVLPRLCIMCAMLARDSGNHEAATRLSDSVAENKVLLEVRTLSSCSSHCKIQQKTFDSDMLGTLLGALGDCAINDPTLMVELINDEE